MLLRYAKLAGGLRLLILEVAPLVAVSVSTLSARTVAYIVGFGLGSIGAGWLAIVATLVTVTGFWGAGAGTAECEAYRAQMRAIDNANKIAMANYQIASQPYIVAFKRWYDAYYNFFATATGYGIICGSPPICPPTGYLSCGSLYSGCMRSESDRMYADARNAAGPEVVFPSAPQLQTYPACSSPDCPPGKKVWTQVLWGSPTGNFVDSKGCFIIAYSQDAPTIPVKLEYNPFLPKAFVESRAISYYLVDGDRFRGLNDKDWKNLESVTGWDKGYWKAEQTDSECRGWRPGWSHKIK